MTNKIWYELVDIKYGDTYLSLYLGRQHTFKKTFKILTLVFSGGGLMGWKIWEPIAWIAFSLIAIVQLVGLIENQLIRSDKEIEQIADLRTMYTRYFNKIEKLWIKHQNDSTDEQTAIDEFFKIRKSDWEKIESLDNKLNIRGYKKLETNANKLTRDYLTKYHS